MAATISAYVTFHGCTSEVLKHCQEVFGGEGTMKFGEAPRGGAYGQVFDRFGVMRSFTPAAETGVRQGGVLLVCQDTGVCTTVFEVPRLRRVVDVEKISAPSRPTAAKAKKPQG
ncbi:hypothetical protein CFAEC_04855 [Corynebacterium faecale]|nr:hypothetical protein CFAEC_04855 [Corynebacterium faecale]